MIKRILSGILVSCLILTMVIPVGAEEFIGTDSDITGYLISEQDEQKERGTFLPEDLEGGTSYVKIFSITANQVTQLLTSNSGNKKFRTSDLPASAKRIIVRASLNHSLQDVEGIIGNLNEQVTAGVCYYGYNYEIGENGYVSVESEHVPLFGWGSTFECNFLIANKLQSGVYYYSYVKNKYPSGYVYGNVQLYYDIT